MTYSRLYISTILFLLFSILNTILAQDIIIKKDNEQLKVKVIEVGTNEIKYKFFDDPDGPTIVINKRDVKTIKLQGKDNKTITMNDVSNDKDPMSTSNRVILDKTSTLKFNFFSPLSHHLGFGYEWMIRPGYNWEVGLGIVGPGVGLSDSYTNMRTSGAFLRTGPKFLLGNSSDIEIEGARYAHPLKGRYFKIEMILYDIYKNYDLSTYGFYYPQPTTTSHVQDNDLGVAFNVIYGRQFIFGNSITVGYYFGGGYGFESKTTSTSPVTSYVPNDVSRYSHFYYGKDFPLTFTGGFTIGYIFKTPEWINQITAPKVSKKPPSRHSLDTD